MIFKWNTLLEASPFTAHTAVKSFLFPFGSDIPQKGCYTDAVTQVHSLVYLGGLDYFMAVNPILKNQSLFASSTTRLPMCVSGFLYASCKSVCRIFPQKAHLHIANLVHRELLSFLHATYITLCALYTTHLWHYGKGAITILAIHNTSSGLTSL